MSTFKIGQAVTVPLGQKTPIYPEYQYAADLAGLTKFHAGQYPTKAEGVVTKAFKHPGFASEQERLVIGMLMGITEHPEEGRDLVAVEIDGTEYIYAADGITAA